MNNIVYIILALVLLYKAFGSFTKSGAFYKKMLTKYTEESTAKYSTLDGVTSIIAALVCVAFVLKDKGMISFGNGVSEFVIDIAIIIVLLGSLIIGYGFILKKLPNGSISKNSEEEDY